MEMFLFFQVHMANRKRQDMCPTDLTTLDFDLESQHLPADFMQSDIWVRERHHIIFASPHQLDLLRKAKTWYMDATFYMEMDPF